MPRQDVRLSPTEVLQLEWGKRYTDFHIYLHGQLIGSFPDRASLKLGGRFPLPGSEKREITVLLADGGLEVWLAGTDLLSGLKSGETDHFTNAANYLIGYGVLQALFAYVQAQIPPPQYAAPYPEFERMNHVITALFCVSLIVAGGWARKSNTTLPLKMALVLLSLQALVSVLGYPRATVITAFMIYYLYKGIQAGPVQKSALSRWQEDGPLDAGI